MPPPKLIHPHNHQPALRKPDEQFRDPFVDHFDEKNYSKYEKTQMIAEIAKYLKDRVKTTIIQISIAAKDSEVEVNDFKKRRKLKKMIKKVAQSSRLKKKSP